MVDSVIGHDNSQKIGEFFPAIDNNKQRHNKVSQLLKRLVIVFSILIALYILYFYVKSLLYWQFHCSNVPEGWVCM